MVFTSMLKKSICGLLISSLAVFSIAEDDTKNKDGEENKKSLTDILKDKTQYSGYVNIYRDPKDGSGYIVVDESQLNTPILYFAKTVNGALDAGLFKGQFRETKLIEFRRYYDRIDVLAKNPRFHFDEDSAIGRAADTNISEAVLVSAKIEVEEKGKLAIKLKDVLLNEQLHKVSPWPSQDPEKEKGRFKLGKFTPDKSRIVSVENFPQNTHVVVDYVFSNESPSVFGGKELSDPRFVSVQVQHAFIELPANDFQARRDDPRLGYFTQQFDDLTSAKNANYLDVINRWHLKKKNPSAEVSDPVSPITWWIENTTPIEWRDTIKKAVLAWNTSFEKAGISNAIQVKVQPDDASWSPNDIRYNVLRWVSSPRPPFGGYGPSIANPLTGEIIAADIMLEYVFLKNRWVAAQVFTDGDSMSSVDPVFDRPHCNAGNQLIASLGFGQTVALTLGMDDKQKEKLLKQAMYYLILHEVGHTLGLNHNMKASQLHDHITVHNENVTQGIITGSVMDYPPVNLAPPGIEQGDFFQAKPGPYDDWAIEYGYSPSLSNTQDEEARLQKILGRSTEPALAFGNDADDMRRPGVHIDPHVNIFDMSGDAVDYAAGRMDLVTATFDQLNARTLTEGESYHDLMVGANFVFGEFAAQASVVSRYIGGVKVDRAYVDQEGASTPYTPISEDQQRKAMSVLKDNVFSPGAIRSMEPLYAYLQKQRRGFDGYGENEDPKLHSMLLNAQKNVFDHLLHPAVTQRISDSALYGNRYSLEEVMSDLTDAVFMADAKTNINSYRRNLQIEYLNRLIMMSGLEKSSSYDYITQSVALYEINKIKGLSKGKRGDKATQVHRFFLADRINRALHKSRS